MSLSSALSSATSSLRAIQTQMAVSSSNIANADDVNYTAKTAKLAPDVAGGFGRGVQVESIVSKVDVNLVRSIVTATSADHAAQTNVDYLQSLSDSLGNLSNSGAGNTLATTLTRLAGHLDELATTPESATLKTESVTDLVDASVMIRTASDEVQTLRGNAEKNIADAVTSVNDSLQKINSLNKDIANARATGQSTADLEDQRNAELQNVASYIGVNAYTEDDGAMRVFTATGHMLVGSEVHRLSFTETTHVNNTTTYPGTLSGISVDGDDITKTISSGTIGALFTLRDTTLPAVQTQMDSLAIKVRDTINTITNSGSASPPPNTLTGTQTFTSATALSATGTLRVALTDASGKMVGPATDLNLSSYATVGDLVTAVNALGGISASLDGNGRLVISADSASNGVAIAGGNIGGKNVSAYFGLNDALIGTDATNLTVKSDLASDPTRLPINALSTSATLNTGDVAISTGSSTLAQSLADALRSANISRDSGTLVSDIASQLSSAKTRASATETSLNTLVDTFSSKFGVNVDEETAHMTELQSAYGASAHILSVVKTMFDDLLQAVR